MKKNFKKILVDSLNECAFQMEVSSSKKILKQRNASIFTLRRVRQAIEQEDVNIIFELKKLFDCK